MEDAHLCAERVRERAARGLEGEPDRISAGWSGEHEEIHRPRMHRLGTRAAGRKLERLDREGPVESRWIPLVLLRVERPEIARGEAKLVRDRAARHAWKTVGIERERELSEERLERFSRC